MTFLTHYNYISLISLESFLRQIKYNLMATLKNTAEKNFFYRRYIDILKQYLFETNHSEKKVEVLHWFRDTVFYGQESMTYWVTVQIKMRSPNS